MHLLDEKIYANALNLISNLGPASLNKLFNHFGSFAHAWTAHASEYIDAGISPKIIDQIIADKEKIKPELVFAETTRRQIEIILPTELEYPSLLKEIIPPPPLLYVRGNKKVLNTTTIAVVGTRKMSAYGKSACEEIVSGLIQSGVTVVSGLAFGIDTVALSTAVSNSGRAIAVLASDLDNTSISPKSNFNLAIKIMENGCLISEFPLGMSVGKQNFPIRNRVISGLSLGTLVIETDAQGGSLITAAASLDQNREVFAVPGTIFSPVSRGTNQLIKAGAKLVTSAHDILEELNLEANITDEQVNFDVGPEENQILQFLTREPIHIDDLIKTARLAPSIVTANLTLLEMKGRVKNLGGAKYVKVR